MDWSSILGLFIALGMILFAVSSGFGNFIDTPSLLIVLGGGTAATIMSVPLRSLASLGVVLRAAFRELRTDARGLIDSLVRFSEIARRDGILALEAVIPRIEDPFLSRGIQLAVDGTDPEVISQTLREELEQMQARHEEGRSFFETLGKYSPAFGMIGTLIGLILMLSQLDEPALIAPNMAVALVTTFYGALLANSFCLPIADKLARKSREETVLREIIIEGLMAIQSGDSPRVVEQKLRVFLPPLLRA